MREPEAPAILIHVRGRARYRKPGRTRLVRAAAAAALQQAHPSGHSEWTIRLADDAELRRLNRQFRNMDRPTDVLSFGSAGYHDGKPRAVPHPIHRPDATSYLTSGTAGAEYLGDIVISWDRCTAQAAAGDHDVDAELTLLVIHGTLHLLGYDHDTPARKARMWAAQSLALKTLKITLRVR